MSPLPASTKQFFLLLGLAALLAGCGQPSSFPIRLWPSYAPSPSTTLSPEEGPRLSTSPTPAPSPVPSGEVPAHLKIPSIKVDAAVESVGRDKAGDMDVPDKPSEAAWFAQSAAPGKPGDALLDGHLDWYADAAHKTGTVPAVFWKLGELKKGAEIDVTDGAGHLHAFHVKHILTVRYDAKLPLARSGTPVLALITCNGQWDKKLGGYNQRLLVSAT